MTRIHVHAVPIDDATHSFPLPAFAQIVHVAPGFESVRTVEFWFSFAVRPTLNMPPCNRRFRVFGTGQEIPAGFRHVGTAVDTGLRLVWHLCEECE